MGLLVEFFILNLLWSFLRVFSSFLVRHNEWKFFFFTSLQWWWFYQFCHFISAFFSITTFPYFRTDASAQRQEKHKAEPLHLKWTRVQCLNRSGHVHCELLHRHTCMFYKNNWDDANRTAEPSNVKINGLHHFYFQKSTVPFSIRVQLGWRWTAFIKSYLLK